MAPDYWVIWNPNASRAEACSEVRAALEQRPNTEFREVRPDQGVQQLAQEAIRAGAHTIVAAGGDGTVNQVVNAVSADFSASRLAVLPLGTANDLCRTLGISNDAREALESLDGGDVHYLDVIRFETHDESRFCINMASAGNSTEVVKTATSNSKRFWGRFAYLRHAVRHLFEPKLYSVSLRFDDGPVESFRAVNVVVANGRYSGGSVPIAPRASAEDGLMEVFVVLDGTLLELAATAGNLLMQRIEESDNVVYRRARRLDVEGRPSFDFSIDGDVAPRGAAHFEVVPQAVPVIVGPAYAET